jgi:hypothetical protein
VAAIRLVAVPRPYAKSMRIALVAKSVKPSMAVLIVVRMDRVRTMVELARPWVRRARRTQTARQDSNARSSTASHGVNPTAAIAAMMASELAMGEEE